jgi:hypothetical protein
MAEQGTRRNLVLIGSGIAIGAAYGLFIRGGAQLFPGSKVFAVMSVGVILVLPFAVGFASVYIIERRQPQPAWVWLSASSAAVMLGIVGTMLVLWEGLICALMFAPIGLIAGMLGGFAAGFWVRHRQRKMTGIPLACVVILPLLITPWEGRVFARQDLRMVENTIEIDAPPAEHRTCSSNKLAGTSAIMEPHDRFSEPGGSDFVERRNRRSSARHLRERRPICGDHRRMGTAAPSWFFHSSTNRADSTDDTG